MKITLQQISQGMDEVIIKYKLKTEQIDRLIAYIGGQEEKLPGIKDGQHFMILPQEIVYAESVEGTTFLYTQEDVYKSTLSLTALEAAYIEEGFFRCSKAMVINIYHIKRLKSEEGNRIDALMDSGEHVVISRRYAKELRRILSGRA